MDRLESASIYLALFDGSGPQIGMASSAQCEITLLEESANWPRMAQFDVQVRLCSADGNQQSEWLNLGRFYTDERAEDTFGNLKIIAFDGMLKMEQSWTDKIPENLLPSSWPITAKAWATMIQSAGVTAFSDLSQLDDTVPLIGLNTASSVRDVLKTIAAAHGGNWIMTAAETLKLIPLFNVVDAKTAIAGLSVAGIGIVGTNSASEISSDGDYAYLGFAMESFEHSPALPYITCVHLETESGAVAEAGTDEGYRLQANCEFSNSNNVAELCLSKIFAEYTYKPFRAGNALLDPAAEIGDSVLINGTGYQMMVINWTLDTWPTADISAPYDQEVDHEYTIVNQGAKTYRKTMAKVDEKLEDYLQKDEFSTAIEQNEQAITLVASHTFVSQTDHNTDIQRLQSQIDGNIQSWSGNSVPTLYNAPAVDWSTQAQRAEHVGDLYFVNTDAGIPEAGQYYRFEENNGVYSWLVLNDSALSEALNKAAAAMAAAEDAQDTAADAQETAQLKGRIWVVQPTPPYDVGDLWFNSDQSVIKVCMTPRQSGSFQNSDWVKRDKYTDDSALNQFLEAYNETITAIQNQVDQKAETYYQSSDPAASWGVHVVGIAIAGLDVVGIPPEIGAAHEGDLWYRTTDNTTWYWNGSAWVQQDVPDEVFDKIDGKAQIFIAQPYPPYNTGDLWFNSATSDIMTCIRARTSGSYVASDWQKRNKYTDDTKANEVESALTTFESSFSVEPSEIKAEVEKRVIKDKSTTKNSFGWLLNDTSHTWYSSNEEVMKVNSSGLSVKGAITATSGYIGTATAGFTINASKFYNGKNSLTSTANGVYVGTDGIALGAYDSTKQSSAFQVTKNGVITARSGTIGGFTLGATEMYTNGQSSYSGTGNGIYLGSNGLRLGSKFKVSTSGDVTASSLNITGGSIKLGGTSSSPVFSVTSAGAVTASNLAITGGSIKLGGTATNPVFSVSTTGAVTASNLNITGGSISIKNSSGQTVFSASSSGVTVNGNGTFSGTIYAGNIVSSATSAGAAVGAGYFDGAGIKTGSIYGGVSSGLPTGQLSLATCQSLGYADNYNLATRENSSYPTRFQANGLYSYWTFVTDGQNLSTFYSIKDHTHDFEEITSGANKGKIKILKADVTGADHFFDIANTQTYKDGVKATTISSRAVLYCNVTNYNDYDTGFDCDLTGSSYHYDKDGNSYGRIEIKNSSGTALKKLRVKMPAGASVNSMNVWRDSGWITHGGEYCITVNAEALDSDGNSLYKESSVPISIQSEVVQAQTYGANSVYVTSVNHKSGPRSGPYGSKEMDVTVYLSNGKSYAATFNYNG